MWGDVGRCLLALEEVGRAGEEPDGDTPMAEPRAPLAHAVVQAEQGGQPRVGPPLAEGRLPPPAPVAPAAPERGGEESEEIKRNQTESEGVAPAAPERGGEAEVASLVQLHDEAHPLAHLRREGRGRPWRVNGRSWKAMESPRKVVEGHGKSIEGRGASTRAPTASCRAVAATPPSSATPRARGSSAAPSAHPAQSRCGGCGRSAASPPVASEGIQEGVRRSREGSGGIGRDRKESEGVRRSPKEAEGSRRKQKEAE